VLEADGGERGCTAAPVPLFGTPRQCTAWTERRSLSRRLRAAPSRDLFERMRPCDDALAADLSWRGVPTLIFTWPRRTTRDAGRVTPSDFHQPSGIPRIALCTSSLNRCVGITLRSATPSRHTLLSALTKKVLEDRERTHKLC
jgi:hypothetical protein